MATLKWFVESGNEELGPLGPGGLRRLVQRGEIKPDTWVRREDYPVAVPASELRGMFLGNSPTPTPAHSTTPRPQFHGPFTGLKAIGWATAAALWGFALLGAIGIYEGVLQWRGEALGSVPLFGLGVFAVVTLLVVGGMFLYWLYLARVNLPHLIHAHVKYAPGWTVGAWLVPLMNLFAPYSVIGEIDRLSAEADADGDPKVDANHALLAPWWASAILGTALAIWYLVAAKDTAAAVRSAAIVHVLAGAATLLAATLAAVLVLRITNGQERAHARHPKPVEMQRAFGHVGRAQRRHHGPASSATA